MVASSFEAYLLPLVRIIEQLRKNHIFSSLKGFRCFPVVSRKEYICKAIAPTEVFICIESELNIFENVKHCPE